MAEWLSKMSTGTKAMRFDPEDEDIGCVGGSSSSDGEEEGWWEWVTAVSEE